MKSELIECLYGRASCMKSYLTHLSLDDEPLDDETIKENMITLNRIRCDLFLEPLDDLPQVDAFTQTIEDIRNMLQELFEIKMVYSELHAYVAYSDDVELQKSKHDELTKRAAAIGVKLMSLECYRKAIGTNNEK